jgi:acyl-CoA thioester hydrolase
MKPFSLKLELRIDWGEIDQLGHVNNLAIMKYVQAVRVHYLEAVGLIQSGTGTGAILAYIHCHFRKALFYPGKVTVEAVVDEIRNTSFTIRYLIRNDSGEIAAEAKDVLVLYDFTKQTKMIISEDLRKKIENPKRRRNYGKADANAQP